MPSQPGMTARRSTVTLAVSIATMFLPATVAEQVPKPCDLAKGICDGVDLSKLARATDVVATALKREPPSKVWKRLRDTSC